MRFTRILFLLTLIISITSCQSSTENTMTVSGTIDGLKKGTLFFQKVKDTSLVTIDSLEIKGDGTFSFSHEIDSPELFYLYLDKKDNNTINDRITFFGEPGTISIETAWNTFDRKPTITGSESHKKYEEFLAIVSKFNTKDLEFLQTSINLKNQLTQRQVDSLEDLKDKNFLRRYKYILNFGLSNPKSFITPYITLTEIPDANPKYLDSIYTSLSQEVAASKYGKELKVYIENLK